MPGALVRILQQLKLTSHDHPAAGLLYHGRSPQELWEKEALAVFEAGADPIQLQEVSGQTLARRWMSYAWASSDPEYGGAAVLGIASGYVDPSFIAYYVTAPYA